LFLLEKNDGIGNVTKRKFQMVRLHFIRHVPYENPAYIETWAIEQGFQITRTAFDLNEPFPFMNDFDWLVVMGGPMSVGDDTLYPWLVPEKEFIKAAIDNGKVVVGICLGTQLIAHVLGSSISKNPEKEIGWFPVHLHDPARKHPFLKGIPNTFIPFHWHGDTFSIPQGALPLGSSDACMNQGFIKNRIIGLQFHFEITDKSISELIDNGKSELVDAPYIQTSQVMVSEGQRYIPVANELLVHLLTNINLSTHQV